MTDDVITGWDQALEAAATAAEQRAGDDDLPSIIRAMKGPEQRTIALSMLAADETERQCEVDRGIFQNIELGFMRDNGDGTYSLTEKGAEHVGKLLRGDSR